MMSNHESSLPENWVAKIWLAMRAAYGAAFDRQWECPAGVEPEQHVAEMQAMWGKQLAGFQQSPSAIAFALENLPPHPPNLPEFRNLCRQWTRPVQKQLPMEPRPVPDRFREAFRRLSEPVDESVPERVRIARRYVSNFGDGGRKLTPFQIETLDRMREIVRRYESCGHTDVQSDDTGAAI